MNLSKYRTPSFMPDPTMPNVEVPEFSDDTFKQLPATIKMLQIGIEKPGLLLQSIRIEYDQNVLGRRQDDRARMQKHQLANIFSCLDAPNYERNFEFSPQIYKNPDIYKKG